MPLIAASLSVGTVLELNQQVNSGALRLLSSRSRFFRRGC
jgi:hypothetical protein